MSTRREAERSGAEQRVLSAAASLVAERGLADLSMRAVAAASAMQTPALYRLFADKQALLEQLTVYAFDQYMTQKHETLKGDDPLDDLNAGWALHIGFGLQNPALYALMFGSSNDDLSGMRGGQGYEVLKGVLREMEARGQLGTTVDDAASRIHAATMGATFFLLSLPEPQRDPAQLTSLRDLVHSSVMREPGVAPGRPASESPRHLAAALHDALTMTPDGTVDLPPLRPAELALLEDWLKRIRE